MMKAVEQRYLKAIRSRVCHSCTKLTPNRSCSLRGRHCPLDAHLRDIVQIAPCIDGEHAGPYVRELRSTACAGCDHAATTGACPPEVRKTCPLNRYLMLAFEAIAEVHEELRAEAGSAAAVH